jgi:superfamily II RNA helicase
LGEFLLHVEVLNFPEIWLKSNQHKINLYNNMNNKRFTKIQSVECLLSLGVTTKKIKNSPEVMVGFEPRTFSTLNSYTSL